MPGQLSFDFDLPAPDLPVTAASQPEPVGSSRPDGNKAMPTAATTALDDSFLEGERSAPVTPAVKSEPVAKAEPVVNATPTVAVEPVVKTEAAVAVEPVVKAEPVVTRTPRVFRANSAVTTAAPAAVEPAPVAKAVEPAQPARAPRVFRVGASAADAPAIAKVETAAAADVKARVEQPAKPVAPTAKAVSKTSDKSKDKEGAPGLVMPDEDEVLATAAKLDKERRKHHANYPVERGIANQIDGGVLAGMLNEAVLELRPRSFWDVKIRGMGMYVPPALETVAADKAGIDISDLQKKSVMFAVRLPVNQDLQNYLAQDGRPHARNARTLDQHYFFVIDDKDNSRLNASYNNTVGAWQMGTLTEAHLEILTDRLAELLPAAHAQYMKQHEPDAMRALARAQAAAELVAGASARAAERDVADGFDASFGDAGEDAEPNDVDAFEAIAAMSSRRGPRL